MRLVFSCLGLVVLSSMVAGCVAEPGGDDGDSDEVVASAASPQIDPASKTYTLKQSGVTVGSAWAGTISSGAVVEYWVSKASYAPSAARTFDGASQTCAGWKRSMCSNFGGATYRKATFTQSTLNCALPPGPCSPPAGASSFLGAGSYKTLDAAGTPFGWTYVSGACEYWSMNHTIGSGQSTQNTLSPAYTSHSDFITQVCAMSPVPSTYFEATYEDLTGGCSAITC